MLKISLCITCCNKDVNLLDSLLNEFEKQTFAPFEIIIYCSGVKDIDIKDKISIANNDVNIFSIISKKLTIQSIARNICASVSSGDVLIFFDVDDIPHKQKIEVTNYVLNKDDIDFLLHSYSIDNVSSNEINLENIKFKYNLTLDCNSTNIICDSLPIHHSHIAVKKSIFKKIKFDETGSSYRKEDGIFCQKLIEYNYKGVYIPEKLIFYTS